METAMLIINLTLLSIIVMEIIMEIIMVVLDLEVWLIEIVMLWILININNILMEWPPREELKEPIVIMANNSIIMEIINKTN